MATTRHRRAVGLIVQQAVSTAYTEIGTLYGTISLWNLTGTDGELPSEGDVKAGMQQYAALTLPRLSLDTAINDLHASDEEATPGLFAIPSTASVITCPFEGQIPLDVILGSQGVPGDMKVFRVSLFVRTVDAGDDFAFDILLNDVSLLSAPIIVPGGTSNQTVQVNATELITDTLSTGDILSYKATAGTAHFVSPSLWITPNE